MPGRRSRRLALTLVAAFTIAGCYSLAEPSFHPGNQRDILQSILRHGIVAGEPVVGQTACHDRDLVANSLYLPAQLPDEPEPRDVYIHLYREKYWERSADEVDACQATYAAANPGARITRLDIPTYRAFGAGWSDAFTEALTAALREAAEMGRVDR